MSVRPGPRVATMMCNPSAKQIIPKDLIPRAILEGSKEKPLTWYSTTSAGEPVENQFVKYQYPAEGCSEIHMVWTRFSLLVGVLVR